MAIPKIMNGPKAAQAPAQNKLAVKPYSGGAGYQTKPIGNSEVISDDGSKDMGS